MAREYQDSPYGLTRKSKKEYLYTKGQEYSLDGINYIGEYHFEGSRPKTGPIAAPNSRLLTKYYNNANIYEYDKARNFPKRPRVVPNQIVWAPIETNYKSGFAIRYFVERIGGYEGYPIEIDTEQASLYGKDNGIDEGVYAFTKVKWKLTGPEHDIMKNGELYIPGIYESNEREVISKTRIIPNLESAIKSYTEYAKVTIKVKGPVGF